MNGNIYCRLIWGFGSDDRVAPLGRCTGAADSDPSMPRTSTCRGRPRDQARESAMKTERTATFGLHDGPRVSGTDMSASMISARTGDDRTHREATVH
jgi:hypothetical protein